MNLASIGEELDWIFDGQGIFSEGRILVRRLQALLNPIAATMRNTARDIMFVEGKPESSASVSDLAEPVVTGTFAGSFGIKIARSPLAVEQASLFGDLIFDRTADRIMQILQASILPDPGEDLVQSLNGLRQTTLNGWHQLSVVMADQEVPSVIRWKGESLVTVTPHHASRLGELVSRVEATEHTRTVVGRFPGGDIESGAFHIVADDPEGERHYHGRVESEIGRLRGIPLGAQVRAELNVIVSDSVLWEKPRETYVLQNIEVVGETGHTPPRESVG